MALKEFRMQGLVPAVFTPMKENGDINFDLIPNYANFLRSKGIKSIFVNGTTGEGPSLTVHERKLVTEAWMKNNKHGLDNVVIHVGGSNLRESQELILHAASLHVDAVGLVSPTFFKPATLELLMDYCKEVAAKAPSTPFFYYNIPPITGVSFNMLEFMRLMEKNVPTFRGIKYSNLDMTEAHLCYNYGDGKYNILFGVDTQLLTALTFGIDAAIGSTYNYMAPIYHNIIRAFEAGDIKKAAQEQLKTQKALNVLLKYGGSVLLMKTAMTMCTGLDMGPCRLPLVRSLSQQDLVKLENELKELGLFKWIN